MNIGTASKRSQLPAKTIRYYEDIGLVFPARHSNGYRDYSDGDVQRLVFLQRARGLGFTIDECRELLSLYDDHNRESADVKSITGAKIEEIDRKIAELRSLKRTLTVLMDACHGDSRPECPIIDDLAGTNPDQKLPKQKTGGWTMNWKYVGFGSLLFAAAALYWSFVNETGRIGDVISKDTSSAMVSVTMPQLSATGAEGQVEFVQNCASCHGEMADGRAGLGPPLVHKIYEPGHHSDGSFFLAVSQGVRSHHWTFGDMQPIEAVSQDAVLKIVTFVREVQRANGIK